MTSDTLDPLFTDERLRPFLPLLHAVWVDGELSSAEMHDLCGRLVSSVDDDCTSVLDGWLDPEHPPAPADLARLAAMVRSDAGIDAEGLGATELGLRLAGSVPDSVVDALRGVDADMGPFGPASVAHLVRTSHATLDPLPVPGEAPFDTAELRRLFDGPHGRIKAQVHALLSRPEFAYRHDLSVAEYRAQVLEWLRLVAAEGIGALGFPSELGGADDPGGFLAAFSTLAHHDLSLLTKFGVQYGLFAGAVMRLGSERHRALVAGAVSLDPIGCFAMTETGHGSNVAGLETTAAYLPDSGEFEIHTPDPRAKKDYIGNAAAHGRTAVVFARLLVDDLDHGVHAFVVPIRIEDGDPAPGVTIEDDGHKPGLNGVDNGRLSFDRVRVPRASLLDRFASLDEDGSYRSEIASPDRRFFTTLGTLVGGRVTLASAAVSVAETALAIAVRYAFRRRQFSTDGREETLLIDYRTHQRRLMPRLAATVAYHFAAADLAARYVELESQAGDSDVDRRAFEGAAAGLKAFATWHALDTVQTCREACGGQGYLSVNRLGLLRNDIDVFTTFEGDNTVLAQLLAKSLLTAHRASFENLTPGRLLRYVGERVQTVVTGAVPVVGSIGGELNEPETCEALLERRARMLVDKLALRIKARTDAGADAGVAFLDVQPHAVSAARAAVELEVYRSMRSAEAEDPGLQDHLDELAVLFGLWRIEADLPWYLETGLVTLNGGKAVRAAVTRLSGELAPRSRHIVDAFGIPDEVLAAPIAV